MLPMILGKKENIFKKAGNRQYCIKNSVMDGNFF